MKYFLYLNSHCLVLLSVIHDDHFHVQRNQDQIITNQVLADCISDCIVSADKARVFYQNFVDRVKSMYVPERVFDGEFQAYMTVDLQNDGPTTLILDTDEYEGTVDYIRKRIEREEMSCFFL